MGSLLVLFGLAEQRRRHLEIAGLVRKKIKDEMFRAVAGEGGGRGTSVEARVERRRPKGLGGLAMKHLSDYLPKRAKKGEDYTTERD